MTKIYAYLPIAAVLCFKLFSVSTFADTPKVIREMPGIGNPVESMNLILQSSTGDLGPYLTDAQGMSLYMFEADIAGVSTCYDQCAQAWPPLLVTDPQSLQVAGDIYRFLIGTTQRADGTTQLTYNGMPLYYFVKDQRPGDITGQGVYDAGALWYLVRPDGIKIV